MDDIGTDWLEDAPQSTSSEVSTDATEQTDTEQTTTEATETIEGEPADSGEKVTEETDDKPKSKDFYKVLGQKKQFEKENAELKARLKALETQDENVVEIEPEFEQKVEKVLVKKQESDQQALLIAKERQAFLDKYPEAVEHMEAIENFRNNVDPTRSPEAVWKTLAPMYGKTYNEVPPKTGVKTSMGDGTKPGIPPSNSKNNDDAFFDALGG